MARSYLSQSAQRSGDKQGGEQESSYYKLFIDGLKAKDHKAQLKAAKDFYAYLLNELKQVKRDDETSFIDPLISVIRELANENNNNIYDKHACIYIITSIISLDNINVKVRKKHQTSLFRFLRNLLVCQDPIVIHMAARAMGKYAQVGVDCDLEFKSALENLKNDSKRFQSILLVRELSIASPTRLFLNAATFYDHIMLAICDRSVQIRFEATELFRLSLIICTTRESSTSSSSSAANNGSQANSILTQQLFSSRLRRTSTSSSLNSHQDFIILSSGQGASGPGETTTSAEYYNCFEKSIRELEVLLRELGGYSTNSGSGRHVASSRDSSSSNASREDRIHGYLLILLEVIKFSGLEFEKTVENYLTTYNLYHQQKQQQNKFSIFNNTTNTSAASSSSYEALYESFTNQLSLSETVTRPLFSSTSGCTCEEMHSLNLLKLLPYSSIDPFHANDPFMFLFKSDKISINIESRICMQIVKDNYDKITQACLETIQCLNLQQASNMNNSSLRNINETIMALLPRLANFDKIKFNRDYLRRTLQYLSAINGNSSFITSGSSSGSSSSSGAGAAGSTGASSILSSSQFRKASAFIPSGLMSSSSSSSGGGQASSSSSSSQSSAQASSQYGTLKSELMFCVGFLSIALANTSEEYCSYAKQFIESIRTSPLMSGKDIKDKRMLLIKSYPGSAAAAAASGMSSSSSSTASLPSVNNDYWSLSSSTPTTAANAAAALQSVGAQSSSSGSGSGGGINPFMQASTLNSEQQQAQMNELNSIMACISMFARSMTPSSTIQDSIMVLLEPLMLCSGGVTYTMRYCLNEISKHISSLKSNIHENLLKILSQILTGRPVYQVIQSISTAASHLINANTYLAQISATSSFSLPSSSSVIPLAASPAASLQQQLDQQALPTNVDTESLVQALQTLRAFEFPSIYMIAFLRYCVDFYLQHESRQVKIEAVQTTSYLLSHLIAELNRQESRSLISIISCALRKLLICAITDYEPDVRYNVLHALDNDSKFNAFVALPENLNILFMCVRDERSEIRELSSSMISRLSASNSAYIQPFIRKILMQLLTEVEIYPDIAQREKSVRLIGHLFSHAPRLVNLYSKPFIDSLYVKLSEYRHDIPFASSIVTVVGQLASQGSSDIIKHFDTIIPFLLESMQDFYYIQLKHTSLWTLGKIVAIGYAIEPYKKYPKLLEILIGILQTEKAPQVRRETIRILGLLGAIDPFEYKKNMKRMRQEEIEAATASAIAAAQQQQLLQQQQAAPGAGATVATAGGQASHEVQPYTNLQPGATAAMHAAAAANLNNPNSQPNAAQRNDPLALDPIEMLIANGSLEEYYPALAINLIMKIIRNSVNVQARKDAIQALVFAMRTLDNRCVNYVELVIPTFLELIKTMNDNLVIDLIVQLGFLVAYIKKHIEPYLDGILAVVEHYWNNNEKQLKMIVVLIDLVQSIVNAMDIEFKRYLPKILPLILKQLKQEINDGSCTNTKKLLHLLRSCTCCLDNYVHLILTQFAEYLTLSNSHDAATLATNDDMLRHMQVKQEIMFTIYTFAKQITLSDNCAILFQSFIKILEQHSNTLPAPPTGQLSSNQFLSTFNLAGVGSGSGTGSLPSAAQLQAPMLVPVPPIISITYALFSSQHPAAPASFSSAATACLTGEKITSATPLGLLTLETLYLLARQMNGRFFVYAPMFDNVLLKNRAYAKMYDQMVNYCRQATYYTMLQQQQHGGAGGGAGGPGASLANRGNLFAEPAKKSAGNSGVGDSLLGPASANNAAASMSAALGTQSGAGGGGSGQSEGSSGGATAATPFKSNQEINFDNLKVCMDRADTLNSKEGWRVSFRSFMLAITQETPISTMRSCTVIPFENIPPDLFNACFVSIWVKLNEKKQNEMITYLELALNKSDVPEIINTILNLAEFIERCDVGFFLPLDAGLLAEKAIQVKSYAKALHYVEEQFHAIMTAGIVGTAMSGSTAAAIAGSGNGAGVGGVFGAGGPIGLSAIQQIPAKGQQQYLINLLEQLVTLNHELQRTEAAMGVLDYAGKYLKSLDSQTRVKERWYEKLHQWEKALNIYDKELNVEQPIGAQVYPSGASKFIVAEPSKLSEAKLDQLMGRLRCLKGLGEWEKLDHSCSDLLTFFTGLEPDSGAGGVGGGLQRVASTMDDGSAKPSASSSPSTSVQTGGITISLNDARMGSILKSNSSYQIPGNAAAASNSGGGSSSILTTGTLQRSSSTMQRSLLASSPSPSSSIINSIVPINVSSQSSGGAGGSGGGGGGDYSAQLNPSGFKSLNANLQAKIKSDIAEMGAAACWGLGDWDQMKNYVRYLPENSFDGALYKSVLSLSVPLAGARLEQDFCAGAGVGNGGSDDVHFGYKQTAMAFIERARDLLDADLTSMASQSYDRSYQAIIDAQVLAELEEIITYNTVPSKRDSLREIWWKRLQGCERSLEFWHRLLLVRSIVLPKEKYIKPWLKFCNLCQKNGQLTLTNQILTSLLSYEESAINANMNNTAASATLNGSSRNNSSGTIDGMISNRDYELCKYSHLKYLYGSSNKREAFNQLQEFVQSNLRLQLTQFEHYQLYQLQQQQHQQQVGLGGMGAGTPLAGAGGIQMSAPPQLPLSFQLSNVREMQRRKAELDTQLAKCYLKLGRWKYDLEGFHNATSIAAIIGYYDLAKEHNRDMYKAWQAYAYANYEAIQFFKSLPAQGAAAAAQQFLGSPSNSPPSLQPVSLQGAHHSPSSPAALNSLMSPTSPGAGGMRHTASIANSAADMVGGNRGGGGNQALNRTLSHHVKSAILGFFTCIKLISASASSSPTPATTTSTKATSASFVNSQEANCLQDTLRLLTIWFDYCNSTEIYDVLNEGIKQTPMEIWLQVLPQLIARIDSKPLVAKLICNLLIDFGRVHPQALVYRLILASKCTTGVAQSATIAANQQSARNATASQILMSLRENNNMLVEQAKMVSEELIRVAILWYEMWHEGLEDASKLYFGERNVKGMLDTLEVLHNMMDRGATTHKETAFLQAYGKDLNEAREFCRTKKQQDIDQAWSRYYSVFKRITKQLSQITSLELSYVSPKLMVSRDLELAVPGTYEPNKPLIRIKAFNSNIQVISSKQRPRKISIFGSNGYEYVFLLKGHEDLRQDERVMQIFGLVNNLLLKNHETARRDLAIQRFSVIPLSQNSGLLEWLLNCDTLHSLIKEYREKKKLVLNLEHKIITKLAPDYEHLTPIQKVQIFEMAIENSNGDDLAKILWHKSLTAEKWLERRTNYTRSLAVMSMVGYVLGLGDRHPSNLMIDRTNGKIIHVDFGDCFETAMTREKFPEKIPFRLTRMLKNAMEVTGIEGTFRRTCESVMKVLRLNRDSVMAVLEAFVYDPLVYWKLVEAGANPAAPNAAAANPANAQAIQPAIEITAPEQQANNNNNGDATEETNRKAIMVLNRVKDKLTGKDFSNTAPIDEHTQVDLLINQATSSENLSQCFIGWCAWW